MPPGPTRCNGPSEAEAPLCLRMALRLCGVADDHQDVEMGFVVQEMLPEWSDRGASRLGAHRADRAVRVSAHAATSVSALNTPVAQASCINRYTRRKCVSHYSCSGAAPLLHVCSYLKTIRPEKRTRDIKRHICAAAQKGLAAPVGLAAPMRASV